MLCNIPINDRYKYLAGTCCLYDNEPFYVHCMEGEPEVYLYDFNTHKKKIKTIKHDDPLFDVATPPLGYVQLDYADRVVYLSRRPHRRWKQGIDRDSVFANFIQGEIAWNFWSEPVRRTLHRQFPPLVDIIKKIKGSTDYMELAVNNDCCLVSQNEVIKVWFRSEEVGFIMRKDLTERPTVLVPSSQKAWIVSKYLEPYFDWK